MRVLDRLIIRRFDPKDQDGACALILSGLEERWGLLDHGKNPDLANISTSYQDGVFLVALLDGEIVGTGALIPENDTECRVVRMSTRIDVRSRGIGTQILKSLIVSAKSEGRESIVLETTESWEDTVSFYLNRGFRSLGVTDGDHHFIKSIRG